MVRDDFKKIMLVSCKEMCQREARDDRKTQIRLLCSHVDLTY